MGAFDMTTQTKQARDPAAGQSTDASRGRLADMEQRAFLALIAAALICLGVTIPAADQWDTPRKIVVTDRTPSRQRPPELFMAAGREQRPLRLAIEIRLASWRGHENMWVGQPPKNDVAWTWDRTNKCTYRTLIDGSDEMLVRTSLDRFHCHLVLTSVTGQSTAIERRFYPVSAKSIGLEIYDVGSADAECRFTTWNSNAMSSPLTLFRLSTCVGLFDGFMWRIPIGASEARRSYIAHAGAVN